MRLNTEIVEARFDEKAGTWLLTTGSGDTFSARTVIAGVGRLVDPSYPSIDGMDDFEREMMHTAGWNHDVDLTNKHVAVIGTGASAVQAVPSIARIVAMLSVFQRTPAWVVAKFDRMYPDWLGRWRANLSCTPSDQEAHGGEPEVHGCPSAGAGRIQCGHPESDEAHGLGRLQELVPQRRRQQPFALSGLRRRIRPPGANTAHSGLRNSSVLGDTLTPSNKHDFGYLHSTSRKPTVARVFAITFLTP
jgi:hypothetical protein